MTASRPHLLYVAWGFPPCRGGGVYRALATANAFAAAGWAVTVITAPREFFIDVTGADVALEACVDPAIEIVRVPFSRPALVTDRAQFSTFRRILPRIWWRYRKLADQVPFPEAGYGPWRAGIIAAAETVHAQRRIDLVLATANPAVDFAVALQMHERHQVPYVLDYRDAWSLDVFSGARVHGPNSRVGRLERHLFAGAREVWFVNEQIRAWHREAYPDASDRMFVVANGWDNRPLSEPPGTTRGPLTFGYLGTISGQVPIRDLLAGWRLARTVNPDLADARLELYGYLGFFGSQDPELAGQLAAGSFDRVMFLGPVSKTEVGELYRSWDVLLLVLGTGRFVTSGKVFEYLATGLPVVSVHDPINAASDVLAGYPRWYPAASLRALDVAEALRAAASAARSDGPATIAAAWQFAEPYQRDLAFAPRLVALRRLVASDSLG